MIAKNIIQAFPKVELHCHLDGSINEETLEMIAGEEGKEVKNYLRAPKECVDLADYLRCFDYVLPFLQTARSLTLSAYELVRQASLDQVLYMEVRFAPQFHCVRGLRQEEAATAVLKGLELGERDFGVKSRGILCMMRGSESDINLETLKVAKGLMPYGVGGIDLAGNEAAYPPENYEDLFLEARKREIPFTIHAGECQCSDNVRTAIKMGARRIGHGVSIHDNHEIIKLCRENHVTLEMCPVSNLQTRAIKRIEEYPFWKFKEEGVRTTINTDNRTVSDTTLQREWELLTNNFKEIDENVMEKCGMNALESAFLPAAEKAALTKEYMKKIKQQKSCQ